MLLNFLWKVSGLNLDRETNYSDRVSWLSVLQEIPKLYTSLATTAVFHVLSSLATETGR